MLGLKMDAQLFYLDPFKNIDFALPARIWPVPTSRFMFRPAGPGSS